MYVRVRIIYRNQGSQNKQQQGVRGDCLRDKMYLFTLLLSQRWLCLVRAQVTVLSSYDCSFSLANPPEVVTYLHIKGLILTKILDVNFLVLLPESHNQSDYMVACFVHIHNRDLK